MDKERNKIHAQQITDKTDEIFVSLLVFSLVENIKEDVSADIDRTKCLLRCVCVFFSFSCGFSTVELVIFSRVVSFLIFVDS